MADAPATQPSTSSGPEIETPGYERRDVSLWAIGLFAAGLLVLALLAQFGLAGLIGVFQGPNANQETLPQMLATDQPPASVPHLQTNPGGDTQKFLDQEKKELNSYGWVDKGAGTVRIPIEQAMEMLSENPPPARAGKAPAFGVFAVPEPDSSGGRIDGQNGGQ